MTSTADGRLTPHVNGHFSRFWGLEGQGQGAVRAEFSWFVGGAFSCVLTWWRESIVVSPPLRRTLICYKGPTLLTSSVPNPLKGPTPKTIPPAVRVPPLASGDTDAQTLTGARAPPSLCPLGTTAGDSASGFRCAFLLLPRGLSAFIRWFIGLYLHFFVVRRRFQSLARSAFRVLSVSCCFVVTHYISYK